MAETRRGLRSGPISILVLVMVVCIAVLAVLSMATAAASVAYAERQGAMTQATYQNEEAAQTFLSQVDAILERGRGEKAVDRDHLIAVLERFISTSDYVGTYDLTSFDGSIGTGNAVQAPGDGDTPEGQLPAEDQGETVDSGTGALIADGPATAGIPDTPVDEALVAGDGEAVIEALFSQPQGRQLQVTLVIGEDLSLEVRRWKAVTVWGEDVETEQLWQGPAS